VPLAEKRGRVAVLLQRFGQRDLFERQVVEHPGREHFLRPAVAGDPVGDAGPRGVLPGQQARPRRRADVARGVGTGEFHPLSRQAVEVGRLVERASVAAEVAPAHVVDEDDDEVEVGLAGRRGRHRRIFQGQRTCQER
jgi:hypothetical protein